MSNLAAIRSSSVDGTSMSFSIVLWPSLIVKTRENALHREVAMRDFFRDLLVEDYEHLVAEMRNHPKDRHVLAAAVACRADYVVTFNLKHFTWAPADTHKVVAIGPSTFSSIVSPVRSLRSTVPGESWRTLMQTFRTKIFLALSDDFSARTASKLCGKEEKLNSATACYLDPNKCVSS